MIGFSRVAEEFDGGDAHVRIAAQEAGGDLRGAARHGDLAVGVLSHVGDREHVVVGVADLSAELDAKLGALLGLAVELDDQLVPVGAGRYGHALKDRLDGLGCGVRGGVGLVCVELAVAVVVDLVLVAAGGEVEFGDLDVLISFERDGDIGGVSLGLVGELEDHLCAAGADGNHDAAGRNVDVRRCARTGDEECGETDTRDPAMHVHSPSCGDVRVYPARCRAWRYKERRMHPWVTHAGHVLFYAVRLIQPPASRWAGSSRS